MQAGLICRIICRSILSEVVSKTTLDGVKSLRRLASEISPSRLKLPSTRDIFPHRPVHVTHPTSYFCHMTRTQQTLHINVVN